MAIIRNTERGRAGEALAAIYLQEQGLSILCRNYRYKHAEIDIVATDGNELVIVEVKIRQNNLFGFPEEAVTPKKENLLKAAGYAYKEQNKILLPVRFDVIAISIEEKEIKYYKDSF
jgi:putative endonuclease